MKRVIPALLSLAAAAALAIPPSAHAALGTQLGQLKLSAVLDGKGNVPHLSLALPAGVYDITAIGTYVYGTIGGKSYQADAACSDGGSAAWRDPLDVATAAGAPISTWHSNRYSVNGEYFTKGGGLTYLGDVNNGNVDVRNALSIFVNGQSTNWVATFPTVDRNVPAGCNTTTHQYDTIVATDGTSPVVLNVFDLNYTDNADINGGITIQVGKLAG